MSVRNRLLGAALVLVMACGGGEEGGKGPAPLEAASAVAIGGRYHVTGVTIGLEDGAHRPIHGSVSLVLKEDRYTAHIELETHFPGSQAVAARAVGTGEGSIERNVLEGSAHTQLVAASVPGVDVGFAFVPREVGPRIASSSRAEFFADGSVRIELENQPEPGEEYRPTRTHLVGYRSDR